MGYAEAIEQQMAILSWLDSGRALEHFTAMRTIVMEHNRSAMTAADAVRAMQSEVGYAEPFYVDAAIVALLAAGAATWPDETPPDISDVFCEAGYVALGVSLPPLTSKSPSITALSWQKIDVIPAVDGAPGTVMIPSLAVTIYNTFPSDRWHPMPMAYEIIPFDPTKPMTPRHALAYRYLCCLFAFVRQRLLTTSVHPVANRQARKRAVRLLEHEPLVRVVELRRREYQQRDESHSRDVEYTCQWLVRGHWRNHFFPSSGEHRPMWIMPHIKGPSDKPLKRPQLTAFEVVR